MDLRCTSYRPAITQPARKNVLVRCGGANSPGDPIFREEQKMDISLYGLMIAVFIGLIWFWNSLYVIKEWERGVVLRLGRMQPDAKGAGLRVVFWPIEKLTRMPL